MTNYNAAILETAGSYIGLEEWPGAKHNPAVVGLFHAVGHSQINDDETPWCAAFVGSVLAQLGLPHTGKLNARSYLGWGQEVTQREARPGDVVVFWRGSRDGWQGHVAFLVRFEGDGVIVRGGNQGNKVSDSRYPLTRVLGYRRATGAEPGGIPVLKFGDRGELVRDLQGRLSDLGYHLGRIDGHFGDRTRAAVLAFQADNGLVTDGLVGQVTREAMRDAPPRPARAISADDLRAEGSETMKNGDVAEVAAGGTGLLVAFDAVTDALDKAEGVLPVLTTLVRDNWPALLAIAAIGLGVYAVRRMKASRIKDALTGANMGR